MYIPIYLDYQLVFKPQPIKELPVDQNALDLLGRTVITHDNYILEIEPPINLTTDVGFKEKFEVRLNRLSNYDLKVRLELPPSPCNNKFSYNDCYKVNYYKWNKVLSPLTRQIVLPNTTNKEYMYSEYWYVADTKKYRENTVTFFKDFEYGYWLKHIQLYEGFEEDPIKTITVPFSNQIDLTQYPEIISIEKITYEGNQEITGFKINDSSAQYIPSYLDVYPLYPFNLNLDFTEAVNVPVDGTEIQIEYIQPLTLEQLVIPVPYYV